MEQAADRIRDALELLRAMECPSEEDGRRAMRAEINATRSLDYLVTAKREWGFMPPPSSAVVGSDTTTDRSETDDE